MDSLQKIFETECAVVEAELKTFNFRWDLIQKGICKAKVQNFLKNEDCIIEHIVELMSQDQENKTSSSALARKKFIFLKTWVTNERCKSFAASLKKIKNWECANPKDILCIQSDLDSLHTDINDCLKVDAVGMLETLHSTLIMFDIEVNKHNRAKKVA